MAYTYNQLLTFAQNAGFQGQSAYTAAAIGMAESRGNPNAIAINDGGKGYNSYGLMQINAVNNPTVGNAANAVDPQTSFNMAYQLSNGGTNFRPWSTYTTSNPNLSYRQFLDPSAQPAPSVNDPAFTITAPTSFSQAGSGNDPFALPTAQDNLTNYGYFNVPTATGSLGGVPDTAINQFNAAASGTSGNSNAANYGFFGLDPNQTSGGSNFSSLSGSGLGALNGLGGLLGGGSSNASWWNTMVTILGDYLTRFGLILIAIILIGAAAWAFAREGRNK